jgi:hypothetical protein
MDADTTRGVETSQFSVLRLNSWHPSRGAFRGVAGFWLELAQFAHVHASGSSAHYHGRCHREWLYNDHPLLLEPVRYYAMDASSGKISLARGTSVSRYVFHSALHKLHSRRALYPMNSPKFANSASVTVLYHFRESFEQQCVLASSMSRYVWSSSPVV